MGAHTAVRGSRSQSISTTDTRIKAPVLRKVPFIGHFEQDLVDNLQPLMKEENGYRNYCISAVCELGRGWCESYQNSFQSQQVVCVWSFAISHLLMLTPPTGFLLLVHRPHLLVPPRHGGPHLVDLADVGPGEQDECNA
jgi:hypothetical protein